MESSSRCNVSPVPRFKAGRTRRDPKAAPAPLCRRPIVKQGPEVGIVSAHDQGTAARVVRIDQSLPLVCRMALVKRRLPKRHLPSGKRLNISSGNFKVFGSCVNGPSTVLWVHRILQRAITVDYIVRAIVWRVRRVTTVVTLGRLNAVGVVDSRGHFGLHGNNTFCVEGPARNGAVEAIKELALKSGESGPIIVVD